MDFKPRLFCSVDIGFRKIAKMKYGIIQIKISGGIHYPGYCKLVGEVIYCIKMFLSYPQKCPAIFWPINFEVRHIFGLGRSGIWSNQR